MTNQTKTKAEAATTDYRVENHGTIYLFTPLNYIAFNHLKANVQEDAQWMGDALVVEHRYAYSLAEQLAVDGFRLE